MRSFTPKESGLTLQIESDGELKGDDQDKIFGQIGAIMSLAIFQQRQDALKVDNTYRNSLL